MQKLSVTGFAAAWAILWGGAVLLTSLANSAWPDYGTDFLLVVSSIYPGYDPFGGAPSIAIGTLYGALDGAVGGAIFAWIYNRFCR